jgi:hypothetical protein
MLNAPDSPTRIAIARELSALTTGDNNYEQSCLQAVHAALDADPPDIERARQELADGMEHAFRLHHRETRSEAWLVAACYHLLSAHAG